MPETWEADGADRTPIIPAHEFARTVGEVGSGVDDLSVGDPVFGLVPFDRDGVAAEFVVAPASTVARKARSVDDIDAAAAVLPVLTAWEALRVHVGLAAGQPVGFDAAIDAGGDELPEWLYAAVRRGGRLIALQQPPDQDLASRYGVEAVFFIVGTRLDRLEELAARMAQGRIDVAITQTYPSLPAGPPMRAAASGGRARGRRSFSSGTTEQDTRERTRTPRETNQ